MPAHRVKRQRPRGRIRLNRRISQLAVQPTPHDFAEPEQGAVLSKFDRGQGLSQGSVGIVGGAVGLEFGHGSSRIDSEIDSEIISEIHGEPHRY